MSPYLQFATSIEALKKLERFRGQFYWKDYPHRERYESVADHSWRLSMLVLLFEKEMAEPFDVTKALKMALIHDLPEIIAGDASPMGSDGMGSDSHAYNAKVAEARKITEEEAATALFGMLPGALAGEFLEHWQEFEAQQCLEAKVVKALDRIECMLQVLEYRDGHMFSEHLEFTISYGMERAGCCKAIQEFGEEIAGELRKRFKEFRKTGA